MTITLRIHLAEHDSTFAVEGQQYVVPIGVGTLSAMLTADPPAPEDLTNAIGLVLDHLEDVTRELAAADLADVVELTGQGVATMVAVEVGGEATLPYALARGAAEDVFRTLVTEAHADRVRNPGLPADEAHRVLGVCCAVVALMRGLGLHQLVVGG